MKKQYKGFLPKLVAIALIVSSFGFGQNVFAASATQMSDNQSTLKVNTLSDHDIRFVTPSGVQTTETITLTFSSEFAPGSVAFGDIDFAEKSDSTCNNESGWTEETLVASSPATSEFSAAFAGNVLTLTSGGATATVATGVCVRVKIGLNATGGTNQITNATDVDNDDSIVIGGTFGDTGTIAVDIITDDQVVITATVVPSINFSIDDNSVGFGNLDAVDDRFATGDTLGSSSSTSGHNLVAGTNATSGYVIYMLGGTLASGANEITAIGGTNTASSTGSEQFGVRFDDTGGIGAVSAPYAAAGYAFASTSTVQDQIASASGPSADTTYDAFYVANIDSLTEAGAYSTTLTYTATATY